MSKTKAILIPAVFEIDDNGNKVKDAEGKYIVSEAGYYTDADGKKVAVITEGSGNDVQRWIKGSLTKAELKTIRSSKGHVKARKICKAIKLVDKMVKDLLANADTKLDEAERKVLSEFITGTSNHATDILEGAAEEESSLPF